MTNQDIALQIQDDLEIFGPVWRSSFAFDVKRIMIEKGLRNVDIAERLQVTEANVSRMLRGSQNFKIETMYLLAASLGESLNICLGDRYKDEIKGVEVFDYYDDGADFADLRSGLKELRSLAMHACNADSYSENANEGTFAFG